MIYLEKKRLRKKSDYKSFQWKIDLECCWDLIKMPQDALLNACGKTGGWTREKQDEIELVVEWWC